MAFRTMGIKAFFAAFGHFRLEKAWEEVLRGDLAAEERASEGGGPAPTGERPSGGGVRSARGQEELARGGCRCTWGGVSK